MASKKGKVSFISNTVAPPADAPSLDFENLDDQFRQLDVSKAPAKGLDSIKPSSVSKTPARGLDSIKPSSSSSNRYEPSRQPASSSRAQSSNVKSPTKVASSSRQSYSQSQSGGSVKGSSEKPPQSSARGTQPPPYKSIAPTVKPNQSVSQSSSSRHQPSQISSNYTKTTQQTLAGGSRVKTEHYKVGNMDRTFVEGLVPTSQYPKLSASSAYPPTGRPSTAPSTARTILIEPEDAAFAQRQTQYASLSPKEQAKQEQWAQSIISRTGSCPEGFDWTRMYDGYQCNGGHHYITDDLLAEGLGGVYALFQSNRPDERWGPYYAEPSDPTVFHYQGPWPKPFRAPLTVGDGAGLGPFNGGPMAMGMGGANANRSSQIHGNGLHQSRLGQGPLPPILGSRYQVPGPYGSGFGGHPGI